MKKAVLITGLLSAVLIAAGVLYLIRDKQPSNTATNSSQATETVGPDKVAVESGIKKGQLAPDFEFTTVDDVKVKLSEMKGEPVIFSFIQTTGCAPCAIEAKNIKAAQEKYPNLKVMQIAIIDKEPVRNLENFRDFVGDKSWLIGYDKPKLITELYNVKNIDTTVMVNGDGKIIYRDEGNPAETNELLAVLDGESR